MRALRKIVFINSAHIRYAEVRVDGNVHFIGTQGVGKSTLLRAILFFYNADKLHLGIPKEMKSFDEFYLPHANSYIVYEVEHEHGPFCILTFRSSGRACYRFIDSEYKKEWLVDNNGEVTAASKVIRERLGNCYMSKIIDRYEQYRDILYGNKQAVGKEFARFQLMETNRYQNIPRSIQNVFLNSRLDANFIKDIIIRSMSEEEANIDLGYFRRQVADFEQEYKDISCWFKLNLKGESTVRKQADNVLNAYHQLLYMKQQISELCGELNYAVRTSRERLPMVEKKIAELTEQQNKTKKLLEEIQQKHDQEKTTLNQEQGVVNNNLKRLKERKKDYTEKNIEDVLKRDSQEKILKVKLEGNKAKLAELTARFNDVTAKYKVLRQNVENLFKNYELSQNEEIIKLNQDKLQADQRLLDEHTNQKNEIEVAFADKTTLAKNKIAQLKDEKVDIEKEILKLKYRQPYKDELESLGNKQNNLTIRENELGGLISTTEANISKMQAEYEKQESAILAESKRQKDAKQQEIDSVTAKLADIKQLLDRTKGSLYEWLEENKPDWEQNIGKVINEDSVLYRTGLHPQKDDANSLFGVRLYLTDLPLSVRKPSQLKEEKGALESNLQTLKAENASLHEQEEKQIDELRRIFVPKIKELRQQKSIYEAELRIIPQKRKGIQVEIGEYEDKAKNEKEAKNQELESRQQDVARHQLNAETELTKINRDKKKLLDSERQRYQKAKSEADQKHEQHVEEIRADIKQEKQKSDNELEQLKQQELNDLHGRGADIHLVEECRASIQKTEAELDYIEEHKQLVYDYRRDKAELFDHEDEFNAQKKRLADELQQLSEKYNLRKQKHNDKLQLLGKELAERHTEKNRIDEDLQEAKKFINDVNLCPSILADTPERETLRTPKQAVDELTSIIVSRQNSFEKFKGCINIFKANFSVKNIFHFRMELSNNEDYLDFANNLDDFIANNKIEEYRRRTSERYLDILNRVSKEMGELTKHESDVEKIINDINSDFRERNFAGVIKLIALRSVPSADKMVQLMKRIKEFNDENQFAMGELNLFSSANREDTNQKAVAHLLDFMKSLVDNPQRQYLTLSDLFQLQFRIGENDNDTGWVDKLSHVGSEGTDTLVKAMR